MTESPLREGLQGLYPALHERVRELHAQYTRKVAPTVWRAEVIADLRRLLDEGDTRIP